MVYPVVTIPANPYKENYKISFIDSDWPDLTYTIAFPENQDPMSLFMKLLIDSIQNYGLGFIDGYDTAVDEIIDGDDDDWEEGDFDGEGYIWV